MTDVSYEIKYWSARISEDQDRIKLITVPANGKLVEAISLRDAYLLRSYTYDLISHSELLQKAVVRLEAERLPLWKKIFKK
jgi:hypothetical protein